MKKPFCTTIKSVTNCPTCGAECKVNGNHNYVPVKEYGKSDVVALLQKYRFDLSSGKTPNLGDTVEDWLENLK